MKQTKLKSLIESVFDSETPEGTEQEVEFYSDTLQTDIKAKVIVSFDAGEKGDYMNPSIPDSYDAEIVSVVYNDYNENGIENGWVELEDWDSVLDRHEKEAIKERAIDLTKDAENHDQEYDSYFNESAEHILENFNVTLLPESHPDGLDVEVEAVVDPRKRGSETDPSYAPVVKFKSIRVVETNKYLPFKTLSAEDKEALTEHALDLFKADLQAQLNEMDQPLDFGRFDKSLRDDSDF